MKHVSTYYQLFLFTFFILAMDTLILVIDDSEDEHFIFKRALSKSGIEATVCSAFDGPSALLLIKEKPINYVFLDYNLPGMNGMEILKKIRTYDPDLPVIMLTGQDDKHIIVELLQAEATDYIAKNLLNSETLRMSIENSRQMYQIRKEKAEAEKALRHSEARLAEAQKIALIGNWEYSMEDHHIYLSDEARRILRYPAEYGLFPYHLFLKRIYPNDVERIKAWMKKIPETLNSDINFRMKGSEEGPIYIHIKQHRPIKESNVITGTIQDVTTLKTALADAKKAQIKRKATSTVLTIGICIFLLSEAVLDPFVDAAFQTSLLIAISFKGGIALFLKPLETFLEKFMLNKMRVAP